MDGKINENGNLYIKRVNSTVMVGQLCPYCGDESACGEWCPLFGEAIPSKWIGSPDPDAEDRKLNSKHWDMKICHERILRFDNFIDERTGKKTPVT